MENWEDDEEKGTWDEDEVSKAPKNAKWVPKGSAPPDTKPVVKAEDDDWDAEGEWNGGMGVGVKEGGGSIGGGGGGGGGGGEEEEEEEEEDWEKEEEWGKAPLEGRTANPSKPDWDDEQEETWDTSTDYNVPKPAPRSDKSGPKEPKPKKSKKKTKETEDQQQQQEEELTTEEKRKLRMEAEEKVKAADFSSAVDLFAGVENIVQKDREKERYDALLLSPLAPKEEKDFLELAKAIAKRIDRYRIEDTEELENDKKLHLIIVKEVLRLALQELESDDLNEIVKVLTIQLNQKTKQKPLPKPKVAAPSVTKKVTREADDIFGSAANKTVVDNNPDDEYDFM